MSAYAEGSGNVDSVAPNAALSSWVTDKGPSLLSTFLNWKTRPSDAARKPRFDLMS